MRSTNALTAATVIKPLHMLLQAGVPDPAALVAAPSSLSRRLSGPVLVWPYQTVQPPWIRLSINNRLIPIRLSINEKIWK